MRRGGHTWSAKGHTKYCRLNGESCDLCHKDLTLSLGLESSHRQKIKLHLLKSGGGLQSAESGTWGRRGSPGERGGHWAPAERMRGPGKDLKLGARGGEVRMPAGYWPGPSEGGDVVYSLVLTSKLNFLAGGRESNLRVQERRRAGRVGVGPCVRGGLVGRARGRSRLEETRAAHQAMSPGDTIVSCDSSHRRLSAQDKRICYPFPLKRQQRQSKGRVSNTCRQEGPEVSVESKGEIETDQGNPEQKGHRPNSPGLGGQRGGRDSFPCS